ncbi:MAG: hypothetical protein ACHRXM_38440 [Isosphaerales bacterium]
MSPAQSELSLERRALLARKGRILYGKSCGTPGRGSCAESFALHQLRLGNLDVVRDLLQFLEGQLGSLRAHDPDDLMPMTEALVTRIRGQLENET